MRNSQAQQYARWSAAAATLLVVVVAGVYLRNVWVARQAEKKAPPAVPPTVEQRSNEFSFSKVEGKRTIYTVRASHTTQFKEGDRNLLEDVSISVYGKKGERNDMLRTRACDFISKTGKISCAGDVQIRLKAAGEPEASANAIQVATSGIEFDRDSGEAQTDKPVTFHWPAGQGRAVGIRYDSNGGTLYLQHRVELTLSTSTSAKPGKTEASPEDALHLTSNRLAFHRESRTVQVDGDVHAQQTSRELSAESLLLELDTTFHLRYLVASGHPSLHDSDIRGPITLSADEISSALRADGSVESIIAAGSVHGMRNTRSGIDVFDAGRVQLGLETRANRPRLLAASGGVTMTSTGGTANGGTRRLESDALDMHFASNPQSGLTRLESVNTLAPARVEWRNIYAMNGKPVPQAMSMSGKQMNLNFDGQNQLQQLVGTGDVKVSRKLGDAPEQTTESRELKAKFSNGSPNNPVHAGEWSTIDQTGDVHFHDGQRSGQGDRAHADRAANTVTLDGSVVLADGTTRTTAQSVIFNQGSNSLRADGHVQTTDLGTGTPGVSNFAQEPAHISADHLVADTTRGHAVYSGGGRLWQGQSVIEADTIDLDNLSHMLVAKGGVRGVFPEAAWGPIPGQASMQTSDQTSRQDWGQSASRTSNGTAHPDRELGRVRGELFTYWAAESRARIEHDAKVDSQQGSIQADVIDLYFSGAGAADAPKQLSRAVAIGDVAVKQLDRHGTSNRAEYTASDGKFVLSEGKPTLYNSAGDITTGRQLTFYFADDRIVVDSAEGSKTVTLHQVGK